METQTENSEKTQPESKNTGRKLSNLKQLTKKQVVIAALAVVLIGCGVVAALSLTKSNNPYPSNQGRHVVTSTNQPSLPDCGTTKQLLQNSPVAVSDLSTIIPMGNIAPPGHIGPTPHMYYNFKNVGSATNPVPALTNIYAPGNITVSAITLFDNASSPTPFNSYRIDFSVCKQVTGYFIHMITLKGKLADAMKPPYDSTQVSHIGGGVKDEHTYKKLVNIKLTAGELMGESGGGTNRPDGLDFGFVDTRTKTPTFANPARWQFDSHYVCSLDYYPANISAQLYSHIGNYMYQYINPGDPKCGTVYQDIPGTAQGIWFTPDQPKNTLGNPANEMTLAHSNLDHSLGVFGLGNLVDGLGIPSSQPLTFTPGSTTNVDFSKVKPDGKVYCYQLKNTTDFTAPDTVILLQMKDASSIRVGSLSTGSCGSGPWQMSTKYIDYVR